MTVINQCYSNVNPYHLKKLLRVRKAKEEDAEAIYAIACSVGTPQKIPEQGFLLDDYASNPGFYKKLIRKYISALAHFYVAEYDRIYGFMIAYTREEWLKENPGWLQDVHWSPDFDMVKTGSFILVDKTAVYADYTGMGIGSVIYKRLQEDLQNDGIEHIFAETVISPSPNIASLHFSKKQKYSLAGVRYKNYNDILHTGLIYYKHAE
ncbi:MAG: N-acetyltransferase family protein [Caulobacteraceae bacterium]